MKGCVIFYSVVIQFIPDTIGVMVNSPCTKTSDWSKYNIRCPINHTIYIARHVIEDGFHRLIFPSLECSAKDGFYCGVELPTSNTNLKRYHILDSAVHICNGRNECTLTKKYFLEAEAAIKKFCNASLRTELQEATFRQSIEYECIQDSRIMDMCLEDIENRHFYQPWYLKVSGADCTCNITGPVLRVKILQTMSVKILIQSNDSNLLEHQHIDVGLYGIDIPVQADNLIIRIQEGSNNGLVLMKVLSKENISVQCQKTDGSGQNKEYSTTELQKVNSGFNGQTIVNTAPVLTTVHTGFNFSEVATRQFFTSSFYTAKNIELRDLDGILNYVKSWMQSLIVITAVIVLLVTFMLLFSIFKQRKDRNLLLTILQKLDDKCSDTVKQNSRADLSHPRLSEDDKIYQQISSQFLCHPNTTRFTNFVYETECMVLENAGDDVRGNVMSLESNGSLSMPEDSNPKGVYELQKII
nr:uncharacterized protein LOC117692843 [Crassostrea gigas]